MKALPRAPHLPGQGNAHNLIYTDIGMGVCPCCGAVWKGDRPWTNTVMTAKEVASEFKISLQAVSYRIRNGHMAAYVGVGMRGAYLIPICEVQRVRDEVLDESADPAVTRVTDLGGSHG
jgi:hypothetical protein